MPPKALSRANTPRSTTRLFFVISPFVSYHVAVRTVPGFEEGFVVPRPYVLVPPTFEAALQSVPSGPEHSLSYRTRIPLDKPFARHIIDD